MCFPQSPDVIIVYTAIQYAFKTYSITIIENWDSLDVIKEQLYETHKLHYVVKNYLTTE